MFEDQDSQQRLPRPQLLLEALDKFCAMHTYLDGVEATARGLRVGVAQRRARLLTEGPVLVVGLAGGAAVAVRAVLHTGVDGPGDGAAVRRADLLMRNCRFLSPKGPHQGGNGRSNDRGGRQFSVMLLENGERGFDPCPYGWHELLALEREGGDAMKTRESHALVQSIRGERREAWRSDELGMKPTA